jgi:hypothetical protein
MLLDFWVASTKTEAAALRSQRLAVLARGDCPMAH